MPSTPTNAQAVIAEALEPVVRWRRRWSDPWQPVERGSYSISDLVHGISQQVGTATLAAPVTGPTNREDGAPEVPPLVADDFVQVGACTSAVYESGDPWVDATTKWLWSGVVAQGEWEHHGTQDEQFVQWIRYPLEGISTLLNRVVISRSRIVTADACVVVPQPQAFNPGGFGNRATKPLLGAPNGSAPVDCHDLTLVTATPEDQQLARWTARQALQYLLDLELDPTLRPTWPKFALVGQVTALDYAGSWDFSGLTLIEAINTLVSPQRGLSWRAVVAPDTTLPGNPLRVELRIDTMVRTATTVAPPPLVGLGGAIPGIQPPDLTWDPVTIPAASRQLVLLSDQPHQRFRATADPGWRGLAIRGAPVRTVMTLGFKLDNDIGPTRALVRGWDSSQDTLVGSDLPENGAVWRVFRINKHWDGRTWTATPPASGQRHGLANTLVQDLQQPTPSDPIQSWGLNGLRAHRDDDPAAAVPVGGLRLEPDMPLFERSRDASGVIKRLMDYAADGTGTVTMDRFSPALRPLVMVGDGTTWTDISDQFQLVIRNDPVPMIILGSDPASAARLSGAVGSNWLLITLSVIEPLPLIRSWQPPGVVAERQIRLPQAQLWQVAQGAILGVQPIGANAGQLAPCVSWKTVRDSRAWLESILQFAIPYLGRKGGGEWSSRLELIGNDDPLAPGALIQALSDGRLLPDGALDPDGTVPLDYVVTAIRWSFARGTYGITLQLAVPPVDVAAFL